VPITAPLATARALPPGLVTTQRVEQAPTDPASPSLVAALAGQVAEQYDGRAALNVGAYNAALYDLGQTVPTDVPWVPVGFRDEQRKGYTPVEFRRGGDLALLPIPAAAKPAVGSDAHLGLLVGDDLVELWRARRDAAGNWSAVWGGIIRGWSRSGGQYPGHTGVSASGLAMPALVLGIREVQAGAINHAVGIGVTRVAAGGFSWPAVRTDGRSAAPDALTMGRRFRLRAGVNVDALTWVPWPGAKPKAVHKVCRLVAAAAQRYGLVVADTAGCVGISVESGAPAKALSSADPWTSILGSTPSYNVLAGFPWHELEALPLDWGRP